MKVYIAICAEPKPLKKLSGADKKRVTLELRALNDLDDVFLRNLLKMMYQRKGPLRSAKVSSTMALGTYYGRMFSKDTVVDLFTKLSMIKDQNGEPAIGTFDGRTFTGIHTDLTLICGVVLGLQKLRYLFD